MFITWQSKKQEVAALTGEIERARLLGQRYDGLVDALTADVADLAAQLGEEASDSVV